MYVLENVQPCVGMRVENSVLTIAPGPVKLTAAQTVLMPVMLHVKVAIPNVRAIVWDREVQMHAQVVVRKADVHQCVNMIAMLTVLVLVVKLSVVLTMLGHVMPIVE